MLPMLIGPRVFWHGLSLFGRGWGWHVLSSTLSKHTDSSCWSVCTELAVTSCWKVCLENSVWWSVRRCFLSKTCRVVHWGWGQPPNNYRTGKNEERPVAQPPVESNHSSQDGQGLILPAYESVLTTRSDRRRLKHWAAKAPLCNLEWYILTRGDSVIMVTLTLTSERYLRFSRGQYLRFPSLAWGRLLRQEPPTNRPRTHVSPCRNLWTWCTCVRASCRHQCNQWWPFPLRGLRPQHRRPGRPPPLCHNVLHFQNPVIPEGNLGIGGEGIGVDAHGRAGHPMTLSRARRVP